MKGETCKSWCYAHLPKENGAKQWREMRKKRRESPGKKHLTPTVLSLSLSYHLYSHMLSLLSPQIFLSKQLKHQEHQASIPFSFLFYPLPSISYIAAEDSDTLPSPTCADNGSSGTSRAGKKRPRGSKSPSKKQQPKPKNRFTDATEKISNTMDHLVDQLGNPPPPPPVPQFCDPYASLWKRIDALPISTNDKVVVGNYLGRQENEGVRGFLASSADTTVETWVYQFMCDRDGA